MDDDLKDPAPAQEPQGDPAEDATAEAAPVEGATLDRAAQLEEELAAAKDQYLRTMAEVENFKKRVQRERVDERAFAAQEVVAAILPVVDNLDRTLAAALAAPTEGQAQLVKGVELVAKQLEDVLRKQGVSAVEAELGKPFDPNVHQPLMQEVVDGAEDGAILEVLQKGYRMGDRLLRAAMVRVATGA